VLCPTNKLQNDSHSRAGGNPDMVPAQAGNQTTNSVSWTPAFAHTRQLKSFKRRSCGGSGFPGAIFVAGMKSFRTVARPTTISLVKFTPMRLRGNDGWIARHRNEKYF
jgi:hypothetical protein